jgi:hypothetical protein
MTDKKRNNEPVDYEALEQLFPMRLREDNPPPEGVEAMLKAYDAYKRQKTYVKSALTLRTEKEKKDLKEKAQRLGMVVVPVPQRRPQGTSTAEKQVSGSGDYDGWDAPLDVPVKPEPLLFDKFCCSVRKCVHSILHFCCI